MKKRYYKEINIARAIGIIMVVLFHSIGPEIYAISYINNICNIIQMPLFFFVSGFVAYKISAINSHKEYVELVISKFKRLIIPYLFLGIFMFIPKLILNRYTVVKVEPNRFLYDLLVLGNNPITFLWFLYVLFMMFIIYSLLLKNNAQVTLIINFIIYIILNKFSISIDIFRISTLIWYANYFILGFIVFNYYEQIKDKISKNLELVILLSVIYILTVPNIFNGNTYIYMINALIGIICILAISMKLSSMKIGGTFEYIGKYSYDIYLLSWFGQNIVRVGAQLIGFNLKTWIVFIGMFVGGMGVMFVSKFIFRKNKYSNKYVLGNS